MTEYTLHLGDCLEIMPTLPDGCADMILCDLPYGTTACAWDSVIPFEPLWAQYKRLIKPRGAVVLFGSQPFTSALVMSNPEWFKYQWVWEKDNASNFAVAPHRPLKYHEDVAVFAPNSHTYNPQFWDAGFITNKGGKLPRMGRNDHADVYGRATPLPPAMRRNTSLRYPKSVLKFDAPKHNGADQAIHPTQKPVALLEYLIRTYTNEGETVLDNTMGSGSTGVACMNTKRKFIGIEKDEDEHGNPLGYFPIAERRIADAARTARGEFRTYTDTATAMNDLPLFAEATHD